MDLKTFISILFLSLRRLKRFFKFQTRNYKTWTQAKCSWGLLTVWWEYLKVSQTQRSTISSSSGSIPSTLNWSKEGSQHTQMIKSLWPVCLSLWEKWSTPGTQEANSMQQAWQGSFSSERSQLYFLTISQWWICMWIIKSRVTNTVKNTSSYNVLLRYSTIVCLATLWTIKYVSSIMTQRLWTWQSWFSVFSEWANSVRLRASNHYWRQCTRWTKTSSETTSRWCSSTLTIASSWMPLRSSCLDWKKRHQYDQHLASASRSFVCSYMRQWKSRMRRTKKSKARSRHWFRLRELFSNRSYEHSWQQQFTKNTNPFGLFRNHCFQQWSSI